MLYYAFLFNNNHHSCVTMSGKCWLLLFLIHSFSFKSVPLLNPM